MVSGNQTLGGDLLLDNPEFTLEIVEGPEHGTVTLLPNGAFIYEHNGSLVMQDQFSYRIINDDGVFTIATVNILVEPPAAAAIAAVPNTLPTTSVTTPGIEDTAEDSDDLIVETIEESMEVEEEGSGTLSGEPSLPEFTASTRSSEADEGGGLGELGVSTADFENDRGQSTETDFLLAALDVLQHLSLIHI